MADVMEIEQLLARYAVGMTQDDIDAVMDVFTPDGTYSAFGATYTLADFPALVAAAPKGLFLTGTPAPRPRRRRHRHGLPDALLRRPDHPRHAHRLVHRHLPPDRAGVAPADPGHDVPPAQRRPRLGQAHDPTRPLPRRDPAGVRRRLATWSSPSSRSPSTPGSTSTRPTLAPDFEGIGTPRPAARPAAQGAAAGLRRRLHAHGLARAGRRPRGLQPAPGLPRRGADRAGPGRARHLLHARGARRRR